MNKTKINYIVDILALIAFLVAAVSGLVLKFFLPSGVRQGRLQEFWGMAKGSWIEVHEWFGILLIFLVVIHLILHWKWLFYATKGVLEPKKPEEATKGK